MNRTTNLTTLANTVNNLIQNPLAAANVQVAASVIRSKSYIQKPATYNRKTALDARRFLAAYKSWATDQGNGMKEANALDVMVHKEKLWIITTCFFRRPQSPAHPRCRKGEKEAKSFRAHPLDAYYDYRIFRCATYSFVSVTR